MKSDGLERIYNDPEVDQSIIIMMKYNNLYNLCILIID